MLRVPSDISIDDAHQWCSNGWVIGEGGDVCLVGDVSEDERRFYGRNTAGQHRDWSIGETDCYWPVCGSINTYGGFAVYVQRSQRRQWTRTYNSRCVDVRIPLEHDLYDVFNERHVDKYIDPNSGELVEQLFDPHYPTFEEALGYLRQPMQVSVAVNPYLIIGRNNDGRIITFDRGRPAAELTPEGLVPMGKTLLARRVSKQLQGRYQVCV